MKTILPSPTFRGKFETTFVVSEQFFQSVLSQWRSGTASRVSQHSDHHWFWVRRHPKSMTIWVLEDQDGVFKLTFHGTWKALWQGADGLRPLPRTDLPNTQLMFLLQNETGWWMDLANVTFTVEY